MADNILDSITEQYHSLTKSGKKLADYVFSHTAETQYLSITSLAENCDVSEATITRFCRGLGLSGYNAFKLALAQADRTTDLGDSGNSAEPVSSEDSIATIGAKVHAANILSLNESYELFDEESMTRAVSILSKARRVYCFGQGGRFGREYIAGIKNGFQISAKNRKVSFRFRNLPNYIKIQLELWVNIFRRLRG